MTASPPTRPCPPPSLRSPPSPCCCRTLSALSIAQGAVMDQHVAMMPSRSDAANAAPTRTHLVGGWAHGANATIAATAMPRSPRWPRADMQANASKSGMGMWPGAYSLLSLSDASLVYIVCDGGEMSDLWYKVSK